MACKITVNSNNVNSGVLDKNDNPSKVFQQILNNPHIIDFDAALAAYSNVYESGEEIPVTYRNDKQQIFTSFESALKATDTGQIKAFSGETELFSVNADITTADFNGTINNLIKSNIIQGETEQDIDGKKLYKPVGNSDYKQYITSDVAITTARGTVGYLVKRNAAGDLYFEQEKIGKEPFLNKDEEVVYIPENQINYKRSADPVGVLAEEAYKDNNRAFGDSKPIDTLEIIPENELQQRLLTLLNNLGVKTVSLDNYIKNYQTKNGVNPDAQALADISNKIVAFADGSIALEELPEEVAHFIIEATEPQEIENLLRNIHRTKEWADYAESYRDVYETEEELRKEILGKVLSNSLKDNFAQNKPSDINNSIIGRLRDLFNNFFQRINSFFKPTYKEELQRYTDAIYNNLFADSLYDELTPEQLDGKKFVLYSLQKTPEYRQLEKTITNLEQQQRELSKKYTAPASTNMLKEAKESLKKAIDTNEQEIEDLYRQKALLNIATVANSQVTYLMNALEKNEKDNYHFAQEEDSVYQNFDKRILPALAQIDSSLGKKDADIKKKIQTALDKFNIIKGRIPANNEASVKRQVDDIIKRQNLTGEAEQRYREQLTAVLTTAQKDTNWFHAHFGQLAHAQNLLLNLAGDVIAKTVTQSRQAYLPRIKQFLNKLEAVGYDPRKLKSLIDKNGYIEHEIDTEAVEKELLKLKTKSYNAVADKNIKPEDFKESLVEELSTENLNYYNKLITEGRKEWMETFFTKEHLEEYNNFTVNINGVEIKRSDLPEVALDYDNSYRGQKTQIRINNNGINTKGDEAEIFKLNKERSEAANPRNLDGSLKKGLREVYDQERGQYVLDLVDIENVSDEDLINAQRIYGLQMIDLINREFYSRGEKTVKGIPQSFYDKIDEFETEQEKWDFVTLNASVTFSDEFWEGFGENKSLIQRLNESGNEELADQIRGQQQVVSNILKANRKFNQPSETDVSQMNVISTGAIKDAVIRLESLYAQANNLLPQEERTEEPYSETRPNDAFRQDLEDDEITEQEDILNYILKHVTPNNASNIREAIKVADKLKAGEETAIRKSLQNVFSEEMSEQEIDDALMQYAESKLLPYYKRTEPIGFSQERVELQQAMNNNEEGAVRNFIENSQYTKINPSYSFYEQNESINPRWVANKEAKRPQYNEDFLKKVRNNKFFSKYGIDSEGNATKNLKEWQAREALLELQDWSLENLGMTGRHNRYLLPQQHKSAARRVEDFVKTASASSIKESIQDMVNFREDEAERAQDEQGNIITGNTSHLSTIPMYGLSKIENQQDVTDELLLSYSWFAQQSALYKARKENIGDMFAIRDTLLNTDFAGKSAESTNTYKMFRSFLNSAFYGQKETFSYELNLGNGKSINLGKLAKVFNKWVRTISLGYSFTVPFTSLLQAKVQRFTEAKVGELTNSTALKLGRKEFHKHYKNAAGEIMGLTSKSFLNVLGESYGMYDLQQRFENSNYNKATRTLLSASSGLHALGNFPVLASVMLSVLNDYRYVNGNIISYNQFLRNNQGKNKKELSAQWQQYDLFYDDILVKDGVQTYNKDSISQKTGLKGEALDKKLEDLHLAMTNRVSAAIQSIDSQIPEEQKSIAARDARASFFLMFQNWFLLGLQQKLKSYHYDVAADVYTEGNWVTTAKFIRKIGFNPKEAKKIWNESINDPVTRRNLKRTGVDIAVANALFILAVSLSDYMDDEDDPLFGMAFLDYFTTRVATEQISSTVGLPRQFGEIIDSPLAAADRVYDLFNVFDVLNGEEVTRGTYAGYSKSRKWLSQNLPLMKDYHRLTNLKKSQDTYAYFNNNVYDWALASYLIPEEEE